MSSELSTDYVGMFALAYYTLELQTKAESERWANERRSFKTGYAKSHGADRA